MRTLPALALLTLSATVVSSTAAAGDSASPALTFIIGGERASGHTLTLAPAGGAPIDSIAGQGFASAGIATATLDEQVLQTAEGFYLGPFDADPIDDPEKAVVPMPEPVTFEAVGCAMAAWADLSDFDAEYVGLGFGSVELCDSVDNNCDSIADTGDTDSDGICDALGDWRSCAPTIGGGGLTDTDGDGVCDALAASDSEPLWGTVVYYANRPADGGDRSFGSSTIVREGGTAAIRADLGTDECHVGVWDDDGLVLATRAPCAEIGTLSDPGGDAEREVPLDQHISLVWDPNEGAWVTKVVWTWTGGGIDVSYHMPGKAWMD